MNFKTSSRLLVIFTAVLMVGCATKVRQHNLPCHQRTQTDVVRSATSILVSNGFRITHSDTLIGLVQAETEETKDVWTGAVNKRVWQISIRHELDKSASAVAGNHPTLSAPPNAKPLYLIATAKVVSYTQNAYGAKLSSSETYYDSDAHEDWEWYWDVRKSLENVCGAQSVITVKEVH